MEQRPLQVATGASGPLEVLCQLLMAIWFRSCFNTADCSCGEKRAGPLFRREAGGA
jgi:hypothetical protein